MSSSNTNFSGSGTGSNNIRINVPSVPSNSLLGLATSTYTAVKDGKISQSEGRARGQQLIQANKDATNLQIINQTFRK